jgi:hypothetical protein
LHRDVGGSTRDRAARARSADRDEGFFNRLAAGEDRDLAAGDRAESHDDRARASEARTRAGSDRDRAAADRTEAAARASVAEREIGGLQDALQTRLQIGQAQGLLAQYRLDPEAAFRLLVRLSQAENIKVAPSRRNSFR